MSGLSAVGFGGARAITSSKVADGRGRLPDREGGAKRFGTRLRFVFRNFPLGACSPRSRRPESKDAPRVSSNERGRSTGLSGPWAALYNPVVPASWAASSAGRAPGSQSRVAFQPTNRYSNNLER
jgi:hypothetical protein